jgi:hypothetical protein
MNDVEKHIKDIRDRMEKHTKADDIRFEENANQTIEILKKIDKLTEVQKTAHEKQETFFANAEPVIKYFNDMNIIKDQRIKMLKATGLVTGVILGVSSVFGVIWAIFKFLVFQAR